MYYVREVPGSSVLIESTDSTIVDCDINQRMQFLYVELAHASQPTQYSVITAFSTNRLYEGSISTYTCNEQ